MEKEKLSAEINKLSDLANKLHSFEEDPNAFLEVIKNLDRPYLEEEHANFKEYSTDSKNILKPVNFAKYIILDKILKNKNVTLSLLDEIKKKIEQKDVDYFKDYPDFKESILNQEDKKFFQSWKNFNILFYVFYDQYKDDVKSILTDIAEHLKENLNLKDAKSTINGFGWNNAFGTSDCWIALYPYTRKSHKDSYQIFMRIYADNKLVYGICNGSNLDEFKNLKEQKTNNLNIEEFEKFLFNEAKPIYDTKNNEIERELSKSKLEPKEDITAEKIDKNFILYGPPGTGKTYQTYEKAVKIIDPDYNYDNRKELIKKFKELQDKGLIKFVTFHQSYSYEEFIEGYRYNPSTKIPTPEAGIFKTLVDNAKAEYITPKKKIDPNFKTNDIYKMSLGDTLEGEEDIYEYCIENNVISLGYGLDIDYTNANTKEEISKLFREKYDLDEESDFNITAMNYFKNNMKENDLVFISKGNRNLRAIGKITGNYYFNPNSPIRFNHFRKVEWIFYDKVIPVERIMNKYFSQQTIYELNKNNLIIENINNLLKTDTNDKKIRNYVMIIDEINRGNISKIFGELITLIEEDKRLGMENEMTATLPYSGSNDFSIPPNIYIIGTMNTADRSIALMDTALRRRFSFIEITPNSKIISEELRKKNVNDDFIEIVEKTFNILNKRIEILLDRDHKIGHSYFLNISEENYEIDLHEIWYKKIIPLILEYFYNDWDNLKLILGTYNNTKQKGFVETLEKEYKNIFEQEYEDETPSKIHEYDPDNFSNILYNTFIRFNDESAE